MNALQTFGIEAFLSFVLVLTSASLAARQKARTLEGLITLGVVLSLCVLLGRPLLIRGDEMKQSIWIHLIGPVLGAFVAFFLYRYLLGAENQTSPANSNKRSLWIQRERILKLPVATRWAMFLLAWATLLFGFDFLIALWLGGIVEGNL